MSERVQLWTIIAGVVSLLITTTGSIVLAWLTMRVSDLQRRCDQFEAVLAAAKVPPPPPAPPPPADAVRPST